MLCIDCVPSHALCQLLTFRDVSSLSLNPQPMQWSIHRACVDEDKPGNHPHLIKGVKEGFSDSRQMVQGLWMKLPFTFYQLRLWMEEIHSPQTSPLNATSSGLLFRKPKMKNLEYINVHRGTKPPPITGSQHSETEIRPRSHACTCVINTK